MTILDPILKYPGAKWRIAPWIISHMPPHNGYLEPWFGSGAVFFNKPPSGAETINDLDGNVVRFFRVCREHPDELADALALTPWSREELQLCDYEDGQLDDVEFARRFAVRCWMTFGSRQMGKRWRHTIGAYKGGGPDNSGVWRKLPRTIAEAAERLRDAQIECRPALDLLRSYDGPDLLIYADPPYVRGTRTLHGDQYACEMTDADHVAMLQAMTASHSMILLSGYDCELYRDMLTGWQMEQVHATAEAGKARTECLWINPAAQDRLDRQLSLLG